MFVISRSSGYLLSLSPNLDAAGGGVKANFSKPESAIIDFKANIS